MNHDQLADVFSAIKNKETIGKGQAVVPATRLAENVLGIMKEHEYLADVKREPGNHIRVHLKGKINDCNVIKPRFSVAKDAFIKWEKQFLPATQKGILILSTTKGIMDHHSAKKAGLGGQLLGYVY